MRWVRKYILGMALEEASFTRRGFPIRDEVARRRLELIGRTFLHGYHAALEDDQLEQLALQLDTVESELRGFAYEGAAMGLTLQDYLMPWKRDRLQTFLAGPGASHVYMVHVGLGWALARLRRRVDRPLARLDQLLGWLAVDGYGFHEGYFHWRHYVKKQSGPKRLSGYGCQVFDQGLGRSLWFVDGADVGRISRTIAAFARSRHADLWSGIGLGCTYAGGADRTAIEFLREAAGRYLPHLAQGAVFAANARQFAGNQAPHTNLACEIICGLPADVAAKVADKALENLTSGDAEPAYEIWRKRIQSRFAQEATIPR